MDTVRCVECGEIRNIADAKECGCDGPDITLKRRFSIVVYSDKDIESVEELAKVLQEKNQEIIDDNLWLREDKTDVHVGIGE